MGKISEGEAISCACLSFLFGIFFVLVMQWTNSKNYYKVTKEPQVIEYSVEPRIIHRITVEEIRW